MANALVAVRMNKTRKGKIALIVQETSEKNEFRLDKWVLDRVFPWKDAKHCLAFEDGVQKLALAEDRGDGGLAADLDLDRLSPEWRWNVPDERRPSTGAQGGGIQGDFGEQLVCFELDCRCVEGDADRR